MSPRIKTFVLRWLKKWTFFENMTQSIELFFEYDSKNWTFFFLIMTQRIEFFSTQKIELFLNMCLWQHVQWWSHARTRNQHIPVSVQSSSERVGALSLIPSCLGISGHPSGSRQGHPLYTGARSAGRPWVARTQFSTAVQCKKHPKHGSGAMSIQGKSGGNESTVDESLLCYGGPRNECAVWNVGFSDGCRRRSGMRKSWRLWCVNGVSRGDEIRRNKLMFKRSCLNVRVGESGDKLVTHWQRQGTLPRYDHHLCSDSSCWKRLSRDRHTKLVWRSWTRVTKRFPEMTIIHTLIQMVEQINQTTACMTKLIMSNETIEERVIAVGKKRNLHPVLYQRDVPDWMRTPWKISCWCDAKNSQDNDHDVSWHALLNEVQQRGVQWEVTFVIESTQHVRSSRLHVRMFKSQVESERVYWLWQSVSSFPGTQAISPTMCEVTWNTWEIMNVWISARRQSV